MNRDEKGNLLPKKHNFQMNEVDYVMFVIPLSRGEVKRIEFSKLSDEDILGKIDLPQYNEQDIERITPTWRKILINEVMNASGFAFEKKTSSLKVKDEWAQDLMQRKANKNNKKLLLFLHTHGYTYFNLNRLTVEEVNLLVEAFNEEQEEIKKASKTNK